MYNSEDSLHHTASFRDFVTRCNSFLDIFGAP